MRTLLPIMATRPIRTRVGITPMRTSSIMNFASLRLLRRFETRIIDLYLGYYLNKPVFKFCRDRCDYLRAERRFYSVMPRGNSAASRPTFPKDFIETLYDQFKSENSKFSAKLDKKFKIFKNKVLYTIVDKKEFVVIRLTIKTYKFLEISYYHTSLLFLILFRFN